MVKLSGPLLSESAHGSIAKTLTYSKRRSGQQARRYNKPTRPASPAQRGQRRLTEFLVAQWQNMTAPQKATWETNAKASGKNLSGYHYFLREAQRDLYLHHGLCGYWSCNEIVNGNILDISGNKLHGVLRPNYPVDAPVLTPSKSPRFGNALSFDGSNDYVRIAASPILDLGVGDFSILFWFKPFTQLHNWTRIIQRGGYARNGFWIQQGAIGTNTLQFYYGSDVGLTGKFAHNIIYPPNKWNFIAVSINTTTNKGRSFLNGAFVGEETPAAYNSLSTILTFTSSIIYHGLFDEISIYNRTLPDEEIFARHNFATRKI